MAFPPSCGGRDRSDSVYKTLSDRVSAESNGVTAGRTLKIPTSSIKVDVLTTSKLTGAPAPAYSLAQSSKTVGSQGAAHKPEKSTPVLE